MLIVKHADHAILLNEYQPCVRDKAMQIDDRWREAADRELAAPSSSAPSSPSHSKWKEKSAKTLALQALAFGRETHAPMGRLARRQ